MYVEGTYFGDLEVLISQFRENGRDSTAVVDSECILMVITMRDLRSILRNFPDVGHEMKRIARKRGDNHKEMIEEAKVRYKSKMHLIKRAATFNSNVKDVYRQWKINMQKNKAVNAIESAKRNIKQMKLLQKKQGGDVDETEMSVIQENEEENEYDDEYDDYYDDEDEYYDDEEEEEEEEEEGY